MDFEPWMETYWVKFAKIVKIGKEIHYKGFPPISNAWKHEVVISQPLCINDATWIVISELRTGFHCISNMIP